MPEAELPLSKETKAQEASQEQSSREGTLIQAGQTNSNISSKEVLKKALSSSSLDPILNIALKELHIRRDKLEKELEELNKRKVQLLEEQKNSFAGQSDAIARRVKGFQEYLTGALQDLAQASEQLELVKQPVLVNPSPLDKKQKQAETAQAQIVPAISDTFKPDENLIRECLEQFLGQPDFYAAPWKLRRSLGPKEIELLEDWFFSMGGRGAQPSLGSRTKNILVSAALISILGELYGDRFQTLVLASQPERLGEWRRGLQDALGLAREDFGPNSGIVLFERGDGVVERADRLEERGEVPLILIDAAEFSIEIPVLQFPLWLAFAAGPEEIYPEEEFL